MQPKRDQEVHHTPATIGTRGNSQSRPWPRLEEVALEPGAPVLPDRAQQRSTKLAEVTKSKDQANGTSKAASTDRAAIRRQCS